MPFEWNEWEAKPSSWGETLDPKFSHRDQNYMGALIVLLLSRLGERQTFTQQELDESRPFGFEVVRKLPSTDGRLEVRIK